MQLPEKVKPKSSKEGKWEFGREIICGFDDCGICLLPLLDSNSPDAIVISLTLMHVYKGEPAAAGVRAAEMEERHVGRPASLLVVLSETESDYQVKQHNTKFGAKDAV